MHNVQITRKQGMKLAYVIGPFETKKEAKEEIEAFATIETGDADNSTNCLTRIVKA